MKVGLIDFSRTFVLKNFNFSSSLDPVLEGQRIARPFLKSVKSGDLSVLERAGRKVRTPQGAMPRNLLTSKLKGDTRGRETTLPTESATENRQPPARTGGDGEKVR